MSGKTGIEWTDRTWNPVVGCTKVSQGCKFCYAKTIHDMRHKAYLEGKKVAPQYSVPFETVLLMTTRLDWPLSLQEPSRIFVNSVSDLFHEDVPFEFIMRVYETMAKAERHTFQILTKRPDRARQFYLEYLPEACSGEQPAPIWPLPNVHLGTSVENQKAADERIPLLLACPAAVHFLSMEPLLEAVDIFYPATIWPNGPQMCCNGFECGCMGMPVEPPLMMDLTTGNRISWVIVGGESGNLGQDVRPLYPEWARALRDACIGWKVPFFFKQWGDWLTFTGTNGLIGDGYARVDGKSYAPDRVRILRGGKDGFISGYRVRVGAKKAGNMLDGKQHLEFPAPAPI